MELSRIIACPKCQGNLEIREKNFYCINCRTLFEIENNIPLLFIDDSADPQGSIINRVKTFYEAHPFPDYNQMETISDLVSSAEKGVFARLLNEQIPFNTRLLEVGCGTGQLSNYLGISQREVFGTDMSVSSLKLAEEFRRQNELDNVRFFQMNLFYPIFKECVFDLVICNGVLHHTKDPAEGFRKISRLVKIGGYLIVGVYNCFGRIPTYMRGAAFKFFGDRILFLDKRLRKSNLAEAKKRAWFLDQYRMPHETAHTVKEVMNWFAEAGYQVVNSIPKQKPFQRFSANEALFKPQPKGNLLDMVLVQAMMPFTTGENGGLFIVIGRRK